LRTQLERAGAWSKLRARVRAELIRGGGGGSGGGAARRPQQQQQGEDAGPPAPAGSSPGGDDPDTFLLNELIREYCMFHGLRDTLSVFLPESGQPMLRPFGRAQLEARAAAGGAGGGAAAAAAAARLPLLYALLGRARQEAEALPRQ
jgi:hypothetical protein